MHERFHLLPYGLAVVLLFIGSKMLLIDLYKIPVQWSLLGTVLILAVTMLLSLVVPPKGDAKARGAYPFTRKKQPPAERSAD